MYIFIRSLKSEMRQYVASKCQTQKSLFRLENISISFRNVNKTSSGARSFVIRSALLERSWLRLYKTEFQTQVISQKCTFLSFLTVLRFEEIEINWFKESTGKSQDTSCYLTPGNTVNRCQ